VPELPSVEMVVATVIPVVAVLDVGFVVLG
jgi:hypothetical protein